MDELEKRLKSIPLREPSGKLEAAVLSQKPEARNTFSRKFVPVRWAVAASLLMGILGFYLGTQWRSDSAAAKPSPVNTTYVYLISDSESTKRWFDLTPSQPEPPATRWQIITNDIRGERHEQSM